MSNQPLVRLLSRWVPLDTGGAPPPYVQDPDPGDITRWDFRPKTPELISPKDIAYAFTAGAISSGDTSAPRIISSWAEKLQLSQGAVYLRAPNGVYRSGLRSLNDFLERTPGEFAKSNQSTVINLDWVSNIDLESQTRRALFEFADDGSDWPVEFVEIGRSFVRPILTRFGWGPGRMAAREGELEPLGSSRLDVDDS